MKTIGKAVFRLVAIVALLLMLLAIAAYYILASIPLWLWVAVVGFLLYKNWRLRKGPRPAKKSTYRDQWVSGPPVVPPAPTVVYVVGADSLMQPQQPTLSAANAPEPWKFT